MAGTLYLVATPIGNLQDITLRALEILRSVDVIACEDTRHTRKLLTHFRISNRTISYHEHNENERADELADRLMRGDSIAVVSDAGTPGISDPAFSLVRRAIEIGAAVIPVPGAVAFVNALVGSGLSTDPVLFAGFLPAKKGERRRRLDEVREISATLVFYEAPHRLVKCLTDCLEILGDREAAVARELTKLHEEFHRGSLSQLAEEFSAAGVRGEVVLVIDRARKTASGSQNGPRSVAALVGEREAAGDDRKQALKHAAKELGISKSEAYKILLKTLQN